MSRPALHLLLVRGAAAVLLGAALCGCAVVSVATTTVGVAATGAGLAVDAAVGTAKAVGSVAGAVLP
ncbi:MULTISPECIES: hypothetical protein [Ramlibacter]|uniref:hypothetical protein n=1 Tax=Ramlibacter TaxID=174951 RepID=UPI00187D1FB5|nr:MULTISPECIES: hypothetical protein [Ramlibacter]